MKAIFQPPTTFATTSAIAFAIINSCSNNQIGIHAFNTHHHHNGNNVGVHFRHIQQPLLFRASSRLNSDNNSNNDSDEPSSSSSSLLPPPSVLCVGEALFDSLPTGIYLGGAPTNVAVHLASRFKSSSSQSSTTTPTVAVAACLGKDQLGKEAHRRLSTKGVRVDYIQFHDEWETGMATAILDENGDATYEFNTPAAWDGLTLEEKLSDLMISQNNEEQQSTTTRVFIMGTIAGRLNNEHGATSSATLTTIRNEAPEGSVVLDVNLRSPWYTPESVLELAKGCAMAEEGSDDSSSEESPKKLALLKLNEEELCILEQWCDLKFTSSSSDGIGTESDDGLTGSILKRRMEQLAKVLNTQRLCVTRGKDGAALLCCKSSSSSSSNDDDNDDNVEFYENAGYPSPAINNDSDTVGAGDAFLAALVASLFIESESPPRALERACALGGYVAGCRGATPEHEDAPEDLKNVFCS